MKIKRSSAYLSLILATLAAADAATVNRSGTADVLTAAAAWSSGAAPTSTDTATWDAASTLANATTAITAAQTWGGLDVQNASGDVSLTFTGAFLSNFGAVNTGNKNLSIMTGAANSSLSFTSITGTGSLTLHNGISNLGMTQFNTANALNFNGTLNLRGGNASTVPGTMAASFFYLGRTGITQAAGTSFALETGNATNNAKDVIIDGDAWNGKTINLTSLSGFGALRSDSGGAGTRSIRVNQSTDTIFDGLVLSHTSGAAAVRKLSFEKLGTGSLTLAGIVGKQTASAGPAAADVDLTVSAGTLVLAAANTRTGATTVSSGATLQAGNGTGTGLIGGSAVTNNGSVVFDYGSSANVVISNVFSGGGAMSKKGDGNVSFSGDSSAFSGNIDLIAGSLRMGPSLGSGTLTVRNGTFISAGLPATNGTSQAGSLVLEDNTESDFRIGTANDQINLTGTLTPPAGSTHTINLVGVPTAGGTIKLIDYSGTALGPAEFSRFALGITPTGAATYQLVNNTAETSVDLLITLQDQIWKGSSDGNWDETTTNWVMSGTPGTPVAYNFEHPSVFNDNPVNASVIVAAGINPTKLTFNNSVTAYGFTGEGIGGNASLIKNGAASVTLAQANSYSGGTTINAGRLQIGNGGATGDIGGGAIVVGSGAALEFNRSNTTPGIPDLDYKTSAKVRNVSGSGDIVLTGGLILFNYTGTGLGFSEAGSWSGFAGNLTVKGGSEFLTIRNGATAMGSGDVILGDATTSGILSAIEGNWTWTNDIVLTGAANKILSRSAGATRSLKLQGVISGSGGLALEDATAAMTDANRGFVLTGSNTINGSLTIATGVPVRVGGVPGNVDVTDTGLHAAASGSLGSATVSNNGTLTFSRTDGHTVANTISGSGALRVGIPAAVALGDTTSQIVTYTGTASHSGTTTVHNGVLIVATGGSMGGSSLTVEAGATLGGTGTVAAPLTAAGTVAPGTSVGTLSVIGNTALTGTLAVEVDGAVADKLAVAGDLTLGGVLTVAEPGAGFTAASYVIAECTGVLSGTLTAPVGYAVTNTGNQAILTKAAGSGFDTWIAGFSLGGQTGIDQDPDNDGLDNGLEFILKGGNPVISGGTRVPTGATAGNNFIFTFERDDRAKSANAGITVTAEAGTNLATWPLVYDVGADTASSTMGVVITNDGDANPDTVTVTIPTSSAQKFFARLKVTGTP